MNGHNGFTDLRVVGDETHAVLHVRRENLNRSSSQAVCQIDAMRFGFCEIWSALSWLLAESEADAN